MPKKSNRLDEQEQKNRIAQEMANALLSPNASLTERVNMWWQLGYRGDD